ncbi:MAG: S-methyl-5-thioribose-1-phosphate isomerase, partial [Rhizobiales bacterium]|nr:S-methyl-5-thioribose-1-phosphate isomerase [Hyphomicrobiales bacterium]
MKVNGKPYRTIWLGPDGESVEIIDQTKFPHRFEIVRLETVDDAAHAIKDMLVRGAPLIGATAAYGMALAMRADASDRGLDKAYDQLYATRPTAVNLRWALDEMMRVLRPLGSQARAAAAYKRAAQICDEDVEINK